MSEASLPAHLIDKLGFEYSNASSQDNASQNAITLAALYSGVVGPSISQPWSSLAKAQWLLKAVKQGSYAVASIKRDKNMLRLQLRMPERTGTVTGPDITTVETIPPITMGAITIPGFPATTATVTGLPAAGSTLGILNLSSVRPGAIVVSDKSGVSAAGL